ncbi:MAG TPA: M1 family peptidase, partial [Thioalkalivibrio sp.]|nr:M1 family peptidase [Thioalkalivibrio sp.]
GANRIVGYNRGALLFEMLRADIGPAAVDRGTRLIRERHLFERAGWDDLEQAFSDAAERELADFFEAWVRRPGLPELRLHSVTQRPEGEHWVLEGTLEQVQNEPPWPLRVPLVVEHATGGERHVVVLSERRADFRIPLDRAARGLEADPEYEVLRRLIDPPTILRAVTLNPDTRLLALQEGLEPFARALLGRIPERTDAFDAREPLLVMGSSEDIALWLDDAGLSEISLPFARRGAARMWTLPETQTVLVSADDAAALQRLVGILRHHGHRSYVVQDSSGRTIETGVWEAPNSVLRVELEPV